MRRSCWQWLQTQVGCCCHVWFLYERGLSHVRPATMLIALFYPQQQLSLSCRSALHIGMLSVACWH
jgi:hypothetical protein